MIDPLRRLADDRNRARERDDPWASLCTVATVTSEGEPSARVLVLRDLATPEDDRLAIFVNATSPKADEFSRSSTVAVLIYLPSLMVQYRLRCTLEAVDPAIVHENWQLRPDTPKRMDWFYQTHPQSTEFDTRDQLLDAVARIPLPEPLVAPATALGFLLEPSEIERLDIDRAGAVHDRRRYSMIDDGWEESVLVP